MNSEKKGVSRRTFIRNSSLSAGGFYLIPHHLSVSKNFAIQNLKRDLNVDLLINQIGYVPSAGKFCITAGKTKRKFEVIDIVTQKVAYKGVLMPRLDDFGAYLTGDFCWWRCKTTCRQQSLDRQSNRKRRSGT